VTGSAGLLQPTSSAAAMATPMAPLSSVRFNIAIATADAMPKIRGIWPFLVFLH
jgi:hypothetical protein